MFTRQQYIARECSHRQYYDQLVNKTAFQLVEASFTVEQLRPAVESPDGTALYRLSPAAWDGMGYFYKMYRLTDLWKQFGDFWSLAGGGSVCMEAARQMVEGTPKYQAYLAAKQEDKA